MKKTVWIGLFAALLFVNLVAWLGERYTGIHIAIPYRLAIVLGITAIITVFAGAWQLVMKAEQEKPRK